MTYMLKRELLILILFLIFSIIINYREKRNYVSYIKSILCVVMVVLIDYVMEIISIQMSDRKYLLLFVVFSWIAACCTYVVASAYIYKVDGQGERRTLRKKMSKRGCIITVCLIMLGIVLCVFDIIGSEQLITQLNSKGMNYFAAFTTDFTTIYYKMAEAVRYILIVWVMGNYIFDNRKSKGI